MSTRDRAALIAVCAVVVIVAPWLLLIQPTRDQAAKLQTQISAAQSKLNAARSLLASGAVARAAFAGSYAALVRLGEAVPTDDNTPSLIYQLQAAAKSTHVDFQGLVFTAGTGGGAVASTGASSLSASTLPPGATIGPAGFPIEPFTFTF